MNLRTTFFFAAFSYAASGGLVSAQALMDLNGLDHFAVNVRNLETSTQWYERIFGFVVLHKWKNVTMVGRGNMKVGLFLQPNASVIEDPDSKIVIAHVAFGVDGDKFASLLEKAKQMSLAVDGPDDSGIANSFTFKDPDGHILEITAYHPIPLSK